MKQTFTLLFTGIILFSACRKERDFAEQRLPQAIAEACIPQTANPAGRSYLSDSVIAFTSAQKNCGLLPLSNKNYWVYQDSLFTDGVFVKVQLDTLRFTAKWKSLTDGLTWWESKSYKGIPQVLYANDSTFFEMGDALFNPDIKYVRKDYSLFAGDSIRYLANFEDAAAMGRSLKLKTDFKTATGTYSDCIYFEKNARDYRKDQVYFKPGLGIIKYIQEKAPVGQRVIKLQQISTLIAFHLE